MKYLLLSVLFSAVGFAADPPQQPSEPLIIEPPVRCSCSRVTESWTNARYYQRDVVVLYNGSGIEIDRNRTEPLRDLEACALAYRRAFLRGECRYGYDIGPHYLKNLDPL